jgi:uncharacterized tellurite resistance protein B-like protein
MSKEDVFISRIEGAKLVVETADGVEEYDSKFLVAALLVYIARSSGHIDSQESDMMIELIGEHFRIPGAEALEIITHAMHEMDDKPQLIEAVLELESTFSDPEKEAMAVMALKVIAADGRREFAEMEQFKQAMEALQISPEIVTRAFNQFFTETMPDLGS